MDCCSAERDHGDRTYAVAPAEGAVARHDQRQHRHPRGPRDQVAAGAVRHVGEGGDPHQHKTEHRADGRGGE